MKIISFIVILGVLTGCGHRADLYDYNQQQLKNEALSGVKS